ncbi:MAG: hypothetical protein JNM46_09730 [Anaerolineales bacterium]|nr:hypothetical protein [Anaerolineales bacterium]
MLKLNFLFIVMDVATLCVYPFIFVHSKLRKKLRLGTKYQAVICIPIIDLFHQLNQGIF